MNFEQIIIKLRLSIKNCRVTSIDFYSVFPTNFRIVFLPHTNWVILLESYWGTITEPALPVANFSLSLGGYSTKAPFTQIRISFACKWPIFLHEYGLPCTVVLSQSLRYLWRIFLAAWEATQQRPSSHKSEYLLHVNGLYFYTNTAFRAHQVSESDTETTSFWNRFRVVYGRIHTNPDWKICGFKSVRIPVVEVKVLRWCDKRWFETWCYTGRFATTIFSTTQRCNVGTMLQSFETMLQRCVALKIVVANRPRVTSSLYGKAPPDDQPLFYILFLIKKVPLSYTFHWKILPFNIPT